MSGKTLVFTGVHPAPAEALAAALPAGWSIVWLGDQTGPKFKRYDWWGSLAGLAALPGLTLKAGQQLKRCRPLAVVGFGGYSSLPVCLAAKWLKLPLVIHEQTFGVGLANRLAAGLADRVAISWRSGYRYFPRKKIVLTGNPVRPQILTVKRRPEAVLYITGGSQGSAVINQTAASLIPRWLKHYRIYHQCGPNYRPFARTGYTAKPYFKISELASIYSRAAAVIGRAGINTVTELGYLRIPAVLIPLPYTQKNEQDRNAAYLSRLGLARVLPQAELTPAALDLALKQTKLLRGGTGFPRRRVKQAGQRLYQLIGTLIRES